MLIAGVVSATLYVWVAAVRAWHERERKRP